MAQARSYVNSRFYLELGRDPSGWLFSADGGHVQTESVNERMAGGFPVRKHAGNVKVDDITVSCGTGMTSQFYDWIVNSMNYQHERKDGAIVHTNYDFKETVRQNFQRALITEIGLPALQVAAERLRNSILSSLSHDLRTPLTTLVGLADTLVQSSPSLDDAASETATIIRDQAHAMHRLLSNLLEMARLKNGQVKLNRQWQPFEEIIGSSTRLLAGLLANRALTITLPRDLPC